MAGKRVRAEYAEALCDEWIDLHRRALAERDAARAVAVRLEQECARLHDALRALGWVDVEIGE